MGGVGHKRCIRTTLWIKRATCVGGCGSKETLDPNPSHIDYNWNHTQVIVSFQVCYFDRQGVMFAG